MKTKLRKIAQAVACAAVVATLLLNLFPKWFFWHYNTMLKIGATIESGDNRTDND